MNSYLVSNPEDRLTCKLAYLNLNRNNFFLSLLSVDINDTLIQIKKFCFVKLQFSYPSIYHVLGALQNCLNQDCLIDTVLLNTHSKCFGLTKFIFDYALLFGGLLISAFAWFKVLLNAYMGITCALRYVLTLCIQEAHNG